MVAIITGITGQDGAYLAKLLLNKKYSVIGITRSYGNSNVFNLKYLRIDRDVKLEECDLSDISSIIKLLKKYKPEEIYNLSAQSSVGLSFEQPIGTIHYNVISVINLLESIRILELNTKFYQASSSEMFGRVENLPITLKTPLHPLSPYAISKATAYWAAISYRESYGLFVSNGILFNHESFLRSSNFFVKKVILESLRIKKGVQSFLKVGNIDIKRDFGYAPQYTEAMFLALQKENPGDYLICSGESISLRSIVYYVFEKLGISKNAILEDPKLFRPNEIEDIYGDNRNSIEQLGWNYNYSFFEVLDMLIDEELKYLELI
ncbi:MAG TPA: GDP-mannose 4,6-dehydratase [Leadbetterella sp.]|nr:GDP-mannose 4,6-dehydratase [Leadbetterella sp.]